jgi:hypothetical protein
MAHTESLWPRLAELPLTIEAPNLTPFPGLPPTGERQR